MSRIRAALDRWGTPAAIVVWAITIAICLACVVPGSTRSSAAVNSGSVYPVRNQLLIEALDHVGVCGQDSAATVWAEGLRLRNAAMQFSVMSPALLTEYARQLESTFPNWVTGVSSPWIECYEISGITPLKETKAEIRLKFTTATSTGVAGSHCATLTVERDGAFWRIAGIDADDELSAYTGFASNPVP